MPAPYNITMVSNSTGLGGFINAMNTVTGGWLGLTFVLVGFFIGFLGLVVRGFEVRESFSAGSHFSFILALVFWSQEWVSDWVLVVNLVMVLGSYVLLAFKQRQP